MKKYLSILFTSIISVSCVMATTVAASAAVAQATTQATTDLSRNLTLGMSGKDVRELQKILATDPSVYPEGRITGYFGPITKKAVESFQQKRGLSATGVVKDDTLIRLKNLSQSTSSITSTPVTVAPTFVQSTAPVTPVSALASSTTPTPTFSPTTTTSKVRVIIRYKKAPTVDDENKILSHSGSNKRTFRFIPMISTELPDTEINNVSKDPNVESVEKDVRIHANSAAEYNNTWGVVRVGGDIANAKSYTGTRVKVAVLDTGIDYTHTDLNLNYAGGYNFVSNTTDPMDDNGHGTHIAGTIAAIDNNVGVIGVAPNVKLYALKVLDSTGSGFTSDIIAALQWAIDNGIQVTNNSYGTGTTTSQSLTDAFARAEQAGIVNVAAAGNSGTCTGDTDTIEYPARLPSVIAVGAISSSNTRPCFSSTGPKLELVAPGVSINSTKLGGGDVLFTGTSMATPHVTGVAALLIAGGARDTNGNGRINDEVRSMLDQSALDLGTSGQDTSYGYGLVQADKALALIPTAATTTVTTGTTTPTTATTTTPVATSTQPTATTTPVVTPIATTTPPVVPSLPSATTTPNATSTPTIPTTPIVATTTPTITPTIPPVATSSPTTSPVPPTIPVPSTPTAAPTLPKTTPIAPTTPTTPILHTPNHNEQESDGNKKEDKSRQDHDRNELDKRNKESSQKKEHENKNDGKNDARNENSIKRHSSGDIKLHASLSNTCIDIKNTLRVGTQDATTQGDVSHLQTFLKSKNYFTGEVTGNFLQDTEKAVRQFQFDNNLIVTGIVGRVSKETIYTLSCASATPL
jgi:subtilisin family serine protease